MQNNKFRPFPFRPFPKEYMLGTTGNFEYFRIGSPILTFTGTTGNDRERPGTGELYWLIADSLIGAQQPSQWPQGP